MLHKGRAVSVLKVVCEFFVCSEGAIEVTDDFADVFLPLLGHELVGHGDKDVLVAYGPEAGTGHVLVVELFANYLASLRHPKVPLLDIYGLYEWAVGLFVFHFNGIGELRFLWSLLFLEPTIEHLGDVGMYVVGLFVFDEFVDTLQFGFEVETVVDEIFQPCPLVWLEGVLCDELCTHLAQECFVHLSLPHLAFDDGETDAVWVATTDAMGIDGLVFEAELHFAFV